MTARTCPPCNGDCRQGRDCPVHYLLPPRILHANQPKAPRSEGPALRPRLARATLDAARLGGGNQPAKITLATVQRRHRSGRWFLLAGFVAGALIGIPIGKALGAEYHLAAHGLSHHFKERNTLGQVYNGKNWGLGVRAQVSPALAVQFSRARNSYYRMAWYGIVEYAPLRAGEFSAGAALGVTHNYPLNDGGPVPCGALFARWQGDRASVTVRVAPPVRDKAAGAVMVEAGWRVI